MKIKSIEVENFRSYKNAKIDLSPNLTAIVGNPQSGKTNIVRALIFATTNRPLGNKFVPKYIKSKKIIPKVIVTTSSDIIEVEKIKTKTVYNLNGEVFEPGTDVPDKVSNAFNFGEMNVQGQLSKLFLITDSPGEVIKTINKITKLEKVDDWIKDLSRKIKNKNVEIKVINDDLINLDAKLLKFVQLDDLRDLIVDIEKNENEVLLKNNEISNINRLLNINKENEIKIELINKKLVAEKYLNEIIKLDVEKMIDEEDLIISYLEILPVTKKLEKQVDSLNIIYSKLIKIEDNSIKLISEEDLSNKLCEINNKRNSISLSINDLQDIFDKIIINNDEMIKIEKIGLIINRLLSANDKAIELQDNLEIKNQEYKVLLKDIGICPTCGTDFDDKKIKEMIK